MKTGIYCRVSTEEQARDGYSLEEQKQTCLGYVTKENHELYKLYVDDGYSAKNMKRPALQEMLEDIRQRRINNVVFWRIDRLSRNSREGQYMIYDIMEKYNVSFKSMTEEYDTSTAQGRMVLGIMLSIAQGERETIAERVRMGMERKHLSGKRNGAIAPYGYMLIDGELQVNEEEAEYVRKAFSLYQQNRGFLSVAGALNKESIGERQWSYAAIYYLLNNPIYCGKIRWNHRKGGVSTKNDMIQDGSHESIISEEEYNRVQAIRRQRNKKGRAATSQYPFSGVAVCSRCGNQLVGNSRGTKKGRRRFYRCTGRYNYGQCDLPLIGESEIEKAFFQEFDKPKRELKQFITVNEKKGQRDQKKEIEKLQKELAAIRARRKKWQLAYANDLITLDELREHNEADRLMESEIRERLEANPEPRVDLTIDQVIEQLAQVKKIWFEIDDDVAKKNFIQELFKSISIDTEDKAPIGNAPKVRVSIPHWEIY